MKYSEIIEIEPFFDSTFNMTEEKENYWKQFITNEKFESNLKEIVNAFTSLTGDQHKSIWVQGTYGTGKSHSTAVIKHLLSDDLDDITDYIDKLANPQLKGMLINFRKKERVFPVVLKGTYSIVDTEELKYASQILWQLDDGIGSMLPVMQTDIMLSYQEKILIIDAKYYGNTTQTRFGTHTLHSGNLYQIFTYVKNKEAELASQPHEVSGMLLYAKTDEEIYPDNKYQMSGNQITVRTLDLNLPFSEIAEQLNMIVMSHFDLSR